MNKRCTCPPNDFPDTHCPIHGLSGHQSYPPMDHHARRPKIACPWCKGSKVWREEKCPRCEGEGWVFGDRETAAEAQRRLYEEARRTP